MSTEMVIMPKNLIEQDIAGMRHIPYSFRTQYDLIVEYASQPAPQQGWNDAIRAVLAALERSYQTCNDTASDVHESGLLAVEALLDQQPKPLVTLNDDNLAESLAAKFGRNDND